MRVHIAILTTRIGILVAVVVAILLAVTEVFISDTLILARW